MEVRKELEGDAFKPILVNQWAQFLGQRVQYLFGNGKLCDLELHLPDSQSLKVHGLVLHAVTDFFNIEIQRQRHCLSDKERKDDEDGEGHRCWRVSVPASVSPAACRALVRFAYTGRLEVRTAAEFASTLRAAKALGMGVAVALLEKQLSQRLVAAGRTARAEAMAEKASERKPSCPVEEKNCQKSTEMPNDASHSPKEKEVRQSRQKHPPGSRVNPRSVPPPDSYQPVKRMKASDVYLKYQKKSADSTLGEEATRAVAEALKDHPLLREGRGAPVRIKLMESTKGGERRQITVAVRSAVGKDGKASLRMRRIREDDEEEEKEIPQSGPWECSRCTDDSGAPLTFGDYYGCRYHHSEVHGRRFDPDACDRCGTVLPKRAAMAHHRLVRHRLPPPPGFSFPRCRLCPFAALNRVSLEKHVKNKHVDKTSRRGRKRKAPVEEGKKPGEDQEQRFEGHTEIEGDADAGSEGNRNYDPAASSTPPALVRSSAETVPQSSSASSTPPTLPDFQRSFSSGGHSVPPPANSPPVPAPAASFVPAPAPATVQYPAFSAAGGFTQGATAAAGVQGTLPGYDAETDCQIVSMAVPMEFDPSSSGGGASACPPSQAFLVFPGIHSPQVPQQQQQQQQHWQQQHFQGPDGGVGFMVQQQPMQQHQHYFDYGQQQQFPHPQQHYPHQPFVIPNAFDSMLQQQQQVAAVGIQQQQQQQQSDATSYLADYFQHPHHQHQPQQVQATISTTSTVLQECGSLP